MPEVISAHLQDIKKSGCPVIGQELAMELLNRAIAIRQIAPAYLFTGSEGVGRKTAAKYFTKVLLGSKLSNSEELAKLQQRMKSGNHPDLLTVQPTYCNSGELVTNQQEGELKLTRKTPPQTRIEQVRSIIEFLSRPPLEAARQVVIVEQAETLNESATNALLKTLEESGQRATFILIASSKASLLPTLVSRCQYVPFSRLNSADIAQVLDSAGHKDILEKSEIMAMAQGSPGQAIALDKQLALIPETLLNKLKELPLTLRDALEQASEIDQTIKFETQLVLCEYLQHYYWRKTHSTHQLQQLDSARQHLLSHCQPRLVWESALITFR